MRKKTTKQLNNYWGVQLCLQTALTDKQVPVRVSAYPLKWLQITVNERHLKSTKLSCCK